MTVSDDVLDFAMVHLDALGAEAVRRYLRGESFGDVHPDLPGPQVLAERAVAGGQPWDALDLVVVAQRVVSGIAWRWIGTRYLLARTGTAPDLQDRRSDGKKVTGQPYAEAAREAITRLARVPGVAGNSLAPANRYNVRFEEIASEWVVTSDLIGATVGPGATDWIDPAHLTEVGRRDGETYQRVVAENAAWVRS